MIYNDLGYLNIDEIAKSDAWLYVIIGARQVGKTYGTLLHHIEKRIPHILIRRTRVELDMIGGNEMLNPYQAFYPEHDIAIEGSGNYYYIKDKSKGDKGENIGLALALSQISHIRGFNGARFASIVFDEFIPEKGAITRKSEGDALLNAYVTINGNRELKGLPPCKLWLLANSNDINSPILEALDLTDKIVEMRRKKIELYCNDGLCIVQPQSKVITDKRAETALMKQIRKDSPFYEMAISNDFAYDVNPTIKTMSIKGMKPLLAYDDTLFIWENDDYIYINRAPHKKNVYKGDEWDREQIRLNYMWLRIAYANELVYFSDLRLLGLFKRLFDIDY